MNDLTIDRRSFHAFEFRGDPLLFDRRTGATLRINDETTLSVLSAIEGGSSLSEALHFSGCPSEECEESGIAQTLSALSMRGMFQYEPVDHAEQAELIEGLWRHKPRRVQLLMAQGCNLGCRYCYAWRNGSNQKGTLMPLEIAKASVDHLVRNSGGRTDLQVTFFGGEPLLNLEVMREVVAYCRELERETPKRFTLELITNGTLLTPEVTDWIVAEKFLLFVSIDGWREMHNYNRPSMNGDDMYDTILRHALYANEQYLKSGLPAMKVRTNLTGRFHDEKKVGEYLASLGFKVIGVGAIEPLPHGDQSPSALSEDQMDVLRESMAENLATSVDRLIAGETLSFYESMQLRKSISQLEPRKLKGITCGVARNTQVVDNKGNIFPCHRYEGMEAYIIGDVFSGLDREKTLAYYHKVNGNATDRCHSCWIRDYCAGGCAWLLSAKDGHLTDPTLRECDRRRKSLELALWLRQKMRTHFPQRFQGNGEIDLDSWSWGAASDMNDMTDADADLLKAGQAEASSCGSGCESCGPSGCAD